MKQLFSGISEIYEAFFQVKLPHDAEVKKAVVIVVQLLERDGDFLGFAKRRERNLPSLVLDILTEENINLSREKMEILLLYLNSKREGELTKKRFLIQSSVTLLIIFSCFYLLISGKADQDTQKAIFGLLGTVLGYWLR